MTSSAVQRKRTIYPGKQGTAVSFNLTALGRHLLKEMARESGLSLNDFAENLIRSRTGLAAPKLPTENRKTGPKGGGKSHFFGKNRGTTSAILLTAEGRSLLEFQVSESRMSRGDYFEYILRARAGCSLEISIDGYLSRDKIAPRPEEETPRSG